MHLKHTTDTIDQRESRPHGSTESKRNVDKHETINGNHYFSNETIKSLMIIDSMKLI